MTLEMKGLTDSVSHLFLKNFYPYVKGCHNLGFEDLISNFDHRCYEGIKIKVQDIALEFRIKNPAADLNPCMKQRNISGWIAEYVKNQLMIQVATIPAIPSGPLTHSSVRQANSVRVLAISM
jgi:hypothetical protein